MHFRLRSNRIYTRRHVPAVLGMAGVSRSERSVPINAAARVEAVTVLFKANGPLAKYRKDLEPLLAQLKSHEKNRHLFAHGHLMLANANRTPSVHFRLYALSKHCVELRRESWTLEQMESIASDIAAYAGRFGRLLDRIYTEQRLT